MIKFKIQKIEADAGFGTVCKVDDGYYSQGSFSLFSFLFSFTSEFEFFFLKKKGVYVTSKSEYAEQYCKEIPKVFVIGFIIVGNPFPVIEHPFQGQKNYNGKPINPGYQSHFTLGIFLHLLFKIHFKFTHFIIFSL